MSPTDLVYLKRELKYLWLYNKQLRDGMSLRLRLALIEMYALVSL